MHQLRYYSQKFQFKALLYRTAVVLVLLLLLICYLYTFVMGGTPISGDHQKKILRIHLNPDYASESSLSTTNKYPLSTELVSAKLLKIISVQNWT